MKQYDLDTYTLPIWAGNEIYYETGMIMGENGTCELLFTPKKIIGVYDYSLQKEFVEGKDFVIDGKKIQRLPNGNMPYAEFSDIYSNTPARFPIVVVKDACPDYTEGREYMTYGERDTYTKKQFAISYEHEETWNGYIPEGKPNRFPNLYAKAKSGKPLKTVVYGDSISTGCNSSGTEVGGRIPPYADTFPVMVQKKLSKVLNCEVTLQNFAVCGWSSKNGLEKFDEQVVADDYDLMILGFGMNDGNNPPEKFQETIEETVCRFKKISPNGEVVLIAPMLPNIETDWLGNQTVYYKNLYELERKYPFVSVANVTQVHKDLLNSGKKYRDMTGNNINHPNDFIARVYAQVILKTILGDY